MGLYNLISSLTFPRSSKWSSNIAGEVLSDTPPFEKKFLKALEIVESAKEEIIIQSGEFSPRYYDSDKMMEAFRKKLASNTKIFITAGPKLSVEDKFEDRVPEFKEKYLKPFREIDKNEINECVNEFYEIRRVFQFLFEGEETTRNKFNYFFSYTPSKYHYIMADSKNIIFFGHHKPQSEVKVVTVYKNNSSLGEKLRKDFMNGLKKRVQIKSPNEFFHLYPLLDINTGKILRIQEMMVHKKYSILSIFWAVIATILGSSLILSASKGVILFDPFIILFSFLGSIGLTLTCLVGYWKH